MHGMGLMSVGGCLEFDGGKIRERDDVK